MVDTCPVISPVERQTLDIIKSAETALVAAVSAALREAVGNAAEDLHVIDGAGSAPPLEYFASVVHQRMYCIMCNADPDTFEGGDPDIALHVIRNSQNIANRYWSADIEPIPTHASARPHGKREVEVMPAQRKRDGE